jgi:murein DD-endopeptidase MepM/ murein hydrolase activator NlpD
VQRVLETYGDVGYVPISWYWPRALDHPEDLDIIPKPGAGNRLTVREYQTRWLDLYRDKLAAPATGSSEAATTTAVAETSATSTTACSGATEVSASGYALPIPRTFIDTNPAMLGYPHHDYPAIDLIVPEGSPVYAVRGGTVARTVNWPHNCWTYGRCDETCGVGISINGDDGGRWIYCHGTTLNVALGQQVAAGQLIMWSGDTGRSGTPHLHLELRVDGERRCPQRILKDVYESGLAPSLTDLPSSGCAF